MLAGFPDRIWIDCGEEIHGHDLDLTSFSTSAIVMSAIARRGRFQRGRFQGEVIFRERGHFY